jgi:2-iminobutanoate/2-iminopropanoate deaminase
MQKTQVNPWSWQDRAGFSQAWKVDGAQTLLFISGQAPISVDGELVGEGDFEAQVEQTLDNLRTVLAESGASMSDIVKLTVFLTDISKLRDYSQIKARHIDGPQPASTALEVSALAMPGMQIEIEAIAAL